MNEPARWYHTLGAVVGLSAAVWVMAWMYEKRQPLPAPIMRVVTDGATGCQYLTAGRSGSLVARMDGQGTHLGCEAARRLAGPGS